MARPAFDAVDDLRLVAGEDFSTSSVPLLANIDLVASSQANVVADREFGVVTLV